MFDENEIPIPQIEWDTIRVGYRIRVVPNDWAKIVLYLKFRNLQSKMRAGKLNLSLER